jgi:hypothetical protein
VLVQIALLDLVFSLDSVITAVGILEGFGDPAQIKPVAEDRWRVLRTSAKDGSGVEVAFSELARDILRPGQDRRTIPDPA